MAGRKSSPPKTSAPRPVRVVRVVRGQILAAAHHCMRNAG